MSTKEDEYWLAYAVREFHQNVWLGGLQKFVLDTDNETERFEYGEFSITMRSSDDSDFVALEIAQAGDATQKVLLHYSLYHPDNEPQIECTYPDDCLQLIEDTTELWTRDFFVLKK